MEGTISVLSTPFNVIVKLVESLKKYQRKKRTESLVLNSFQDEAEIYIHAYNEISELSNEELIPIIEEVEGEITLHNLNQLLEAMLPLPLKNAEWINAFIKLAKACSEVSSFKGLMEHLKEDDILLYDFVHVMKNTYDTKKNRVAVDGQYFRFFKTYENEIFGKVKSEEVISISEKMELFIKKIERFNRKLKHYITKTSLIRRWIIKKYRKNYRTFLKSAENMTIDRAIVKDLMDYVPNKLLPITVFLEDFQP